MTREVVREIDINALPPRVWRVLTDFRRYPQWNPFITSISGDLRPGGRLRLHLGPRGREGVDVRGRVREVRPNLLLRWKSGSLFPGLLSSVHSYELRSLGRGRTRFTQREVFRGLLVPLLGKSIESTGRALEIMNEALKARLEGAAVVRRRRRAA